MKHYYILSLKHSPVQGMALWWGPNDSGYTMNLASAGIYSEEQVSEKPLYYNNGESTKAVLVDAVLAASHQVVDMTAALNASEKSSFSDWWWDALEGRR